MDRRPTLVFRRFRYFETIVPPSAGGRALLPAVATQVKTGLFWSVAFGTEHSLLEITLPLRVRPFLLTPGQCNSRPRFGAV